MLRKRLLRKRRSTLRSCPTYQIPTMPPLTFPARPHPALTMRGRGRQWRGSYGGMPTGIWGSRRVPTQHEHWKKLWKTGWPVPKKTNAAKKTPNLMTATTRPPVSEFIREITRATEEDRKRRYPSLSKSIKYYPILSNTTQYYPWLWNLDMVRNLHREERQRKQRQLENQVFDLNSTVDFIFFSRLSNVAKVIRLEFLVNWTQYWRRKRKGLFLFQQN